jgi:hypothetical protein
MALASPDAASLGAASLTAGDRVDAAGEPGSSAAQAGAAVKERARATAGIKGRMSPR